MSESSITAPVVVGVDGSQSAADALRWALDEAIARHAALRVVSATGVEERSARAHRPAIEDAERSLRAARAVVEAAGNPVEVDTDLLWGPVSIALIDESRTAAVLCVGAVGADGHAGEALGSTAAALAENTHCPLAIVRGNGGRDGGVNWIVMVVNDDRDNDAVIECTLREAELRQAPVLAVGVGADDLGETSYDELDRRVAKWKLRHPGVRIHAVVTLGGIGQFLACHADDSVQLAVLGEGDVDQIAYLVWPQNQTTPPRGERSILVVPHPVAAG